MRKGHLPQEIQEYVIDLLISNGPITRKEYLQLQLRLVCRAWIPRTNFHIFRNISVEAAEGPALLFIIKSSKFGIGAYIRHLRIYANATLRNRALFQYYNDEAGLREYLRGLIEYLPYLESLRVTRLFPDQVAWIPCFSTIKSLIMFEVSIWPSQIVKLISAAKLLESLTNIGCDVYEEGSIQPHPSSSSILSSSVCLKNIKSYETSLTNLNTLLLDSHLFPFGLGPILPSLSRLNLREICPKNMSMATHLLKAGPSSLKFLQLWFSEHYNPGSYKQFFDLSCFEQLQFIRLRYIRSRSSTRVIDIDVVLVALESLPNDIKDLTVSLLFSEGLDEGCEFFQRIDSLLANNVGVSAVEIIPQNSKDQHKMRRVFPHLLEKEKIFMVRDWSEASQVFPT